MTPALLAAVIQAVVLGIAQDGGVPHIGCTQALCVASRRDPALRQRVAALGLVDGDRRYLIDATPDIAYHTNRLLTDDGARAAAAQGIVVARDGESIPLSSPGVP